MVTTCGGPQHVQSMTKYGNGTIQGSIQSGAVLVVWSWVKMCWGPPHVTDTHCPATQAYMLSVLIMLLSSTILLYYTPLSHDTHVLCVYV